MPAQITIPETTIPRALFINDLQSSGADLAAFYSCRALWAPLSAAERPEPESRALRRAHLWYLGWSEKSNGREATGLSYIGTLAAICTTTAFIPQILKIKRQGGDDLSY